MRQFRPVAAPPGRLVRLGLVLDPRNDPNQIMRIAQMAERAKFGSLWVNDRLATPDHSVRLESWTMLTIAGMYTSSVRVGAMFTSSLRLPQSLAAMVGSFDVVLKGRLEMGVCTGWFEREHTGFGLRFPDETARLEQMGEFAETLSTLSRGEPMFEDGLKIGVVSPQPGGPPLTMEVKGRESLALALQHADSILLPASPLSEVHAMIARACEASEEAGRDPSSLGFAVQLPVSVGRTDAESDVRVEVDDVLAQMNARETGMQGDLEHCQDIMIELAHLGVGEVRCVLPHVPDIDDVIAQLSATAIGTTDVLKPGTSRSQAPPPPPGWGGPTRVSGTQGPP
jgi:alkanesulfonate monooxygenase SsuD/methylene tetrahydromethanopterin reductase-like flavin-dependent oxidoreductase (luciferase family)